MRAAISKNIDMLKTLLQIETVDVNAGDPDDNTAACEQAVSELSQSTRIDLNAKNRNGETALMLAVTNKHLDAVKTLSKAPGIDANVKNAFGKTPLMEAAHIKDGSNRDALMYAKQFRYKDVEDILLNYHEKQV
jgi:ankyrin repeat protein